VTLRQADYERIRIEHRGAVAVLTLDRAKRRNAVDDRMHSELSTVFRAAQADPAVRAVVLTGAGEAFSVGGDTSADRRFETATGRGVMAEARAIIADVLDLEKPLVAAVNGHAIGLGATLALRRPALHRRPRRGARLLRDGRVEKARVRRPGDGGDQEGVREMPADLTAANLR
jgi:1,4-dihydroxy-2-naphthoyl-CoA synthase